MKLAPIALALVIAGGGPVAAQADENTRESDMAVSVVRAASHCFIDRLAASGTFSATHVAEVRPDREGLVLSEVLIEPGDVIAKDQVLARLISAQGSQEPIALKAPVAGVVIAAAATIGAYTSPTSDPLFRIAEGGDIELKAEIRATSLSRLRKGMAARVHVVGLGDVIGRIASIDDGVDPQTQLGTLRLTIPRDPRLRVGSFARAEIDAGQDCGLTVPLSALLFGPEGAAVAIVQSDRVVMRVVTTGLLDGGNIEIRAGLTEDDFVIARAGPFLREGDHVRSVSNTP